MNKHLFSEKGKRESNQDYILSKECNSDTSIYIVADGMGGYEKGFMAAQIAANTIADNFTNQVSEKKEEVILDAITQANNEIAQIKIKENIKMGTTIAGVHIQKNRFLAFWVGDVKIIHISNNQIVFESKDHSLINQLKDTDLNPSITALDNIRHIVIRSIQGDSNKFQPDFHSGEIKIGDMVLICSDGFFELMGATQVKNLNSEKLEKLRNRSKSCSDNASAIILSF